MDFTPFVNFRNPLCCKLFKFSNLQQISGKTYSAPSDSVSRARVVKQPLFRFGTLIKIYRLNLTQAFRPTF
jgi:hypothetical protein